MSCPHSAKTIITGIRQIVSETNGDLLGHQLVLTIKCDQCGEPVFHFPGLTPGLGLNHPQVSADATEMRIPLRPGKSIPVDFNIPAHDQTN
jgi:hypothetical protein